MYVNSSRDLHGVFVRLYADWTSITLRSRSSNLHFARFLEIESNDSVRYTYFELVIPFRNNPYS